jgi:hypothetical protein
MRMSKSISEFIGWVFSRAISVAKIHAVAARGLAKVLAERSDFFDSNVKRSGQHLRCSLMMIHVFAVCRSLAAGRKKAIRANADSRSLRKLAHLYESFLGSGLQARYSRGSPDDGTHCAISARCLPSYRATCAVGSSYRPNLVPLHRGIDVLAEQHCRVPPTSGLG